jgi:hypothetical protein
MRNDLKFYIIAIFAPVAYFEIDLAQNLSAFRIKPSNIFRKEFEIISQLCNRAFRPEMASKCQHPYELNSFEADNQYTPLHNSRKGFEIAIGFQFKPTAG